MGCVVPSFLGDQLQAMSEMRLVPIWQSAADPEPRGRRPSAHAAGSTRQAAGSHAGLAGDRPGRDLLAHLSWPGMARATDADYDTCPPCSPPSCARPRAAEPMIGRAASADSVPAAADRADDPLPRGDPGRRRAVRHAAPLAEHHQDRARRSGSRHDRTAARSRADRAAHRRVRQPPVLHRASSTSARESGRSPSSTCRAGSWRRATPADRYAIDGRDADHGHRTRPAIANRYRRLPAGLAAGSLLE